MRVAIADDAKDIARVLNANLGEMYASPTDIAALIEDKNWVFYVAENNDNRVVAVASGHTIAKTEALSPYLMEHWDTVGDKVSTAGPVLLIKSVAVDEIYRGRGLASDLVRHLIQWGRHQECETLFSIGWTDSDGCHIEPVFSKLGINSLLDIENFWTSDSLKQGYLCPHCGNPCECSAKIFTGKLSAPGKYPIIF